MSKKIFITGTGTDVGKTYVTGLIIKKLWGNKRNAAYYKAAMSGNDRRADGSLLAGDALHVKAVSGIAQPISGFSASGGPHGGQSSGAEAGAP